MDKKTVIIATAMLMTALFVAPMAVYAQLTPHGVQGIVYMSDEVTEAPWGTSFSVHDTTSGDFIPGTTGAPGHNGWYSVSINGEDGDTVVIRAGNTTYYNETTVTLAGNMVGIDLIMDLKPENVEVPALTPVGTIALVGLLSIAVAVGIRKKKV